MKNMGKVCKLRIIVGLSVPLELGNFNRKREWIQRIKVLKVQANKEITAVVKINYIFRMKYNLLQSLPMSIKVFQWVLQQ